MVGVIIVAAVFFFLTTMMLVEKQSGGSVEHSDDKCDDSEKRMWSYIEDKLSGVTTETHNITCDGWSVIRLWIINREIYIDCVDDRNNIKRFNSLSDISSLYKFVYNATITDKPDIECEKILKSCINMKGVSKWIQIGNYYFYNIFENYTCYYPHRECFIRDIRDWDNKLYFGEDVLEILDSSTITPCDDPKKTYWKEFQEYSFKKKKLRDVEMKNWVDGILDKKKEYDDLQFKYDCLPSAPITDLDTFKNFCNILHESNEGSYEDYEIQNYLSLLLSK